jgi:hypothetical protein
MKVAVEVARVAGYMLGECYNQWWSKDLDPPLPKIPKKQQKLPVGGLLDQMARALGEIDRDLPRLEAYIRRERKKLRGY